MWIVASLHLLLQQNNQLLLLSAENYVTVTAISEHKNKNILVIYIYTTTETKCMQQTRWICIYTLVLMITIIRK